MKSIKGSVCGRSHIRGVWLSTGSSDAAELAAAAGFDWALLDMEHGTGSTADVMQQIRLLTQTDCIPVVRVPSPGSDAVKQALDCGASGIMAPMVANAEQAKRFVRSLRYPPEGTRGLTRSSRASRYGYDFPEYFKEINAATTGIIQIESAEAVKEVDAIAATDGVDVLFIGHTDLSLNLNCFEDYDAPAMQAAEKAVLAACARHHKRAGMQVKAGMALEHYRAKGFSILALGSDIGCLKGGFDALLRCSD